MTAPQVQWRYRLYVAGRDTAGVDHVAGWVTDAGTVAAELVGSLDVVRGAWRLLVEGRRPVGMADVMGGWMSMVVSPVRAQRRWLVSVDDVGRQRWGRWEPAEFVRDGGVTDVVEGTRQVVRGREPHQPELPR